MSTIDEILATMPENAISDVTDEVIVIDPATRQMNIPSSELVFGVESDSHSERKYFIVPRVVGNDIDLTSCFIRVNYRNGNGEMDAYLVDDVTLVDDKVLFSWELSGKVTAYRGQVTFVVCACRPGGNGADAVEWHTTQATGLVLDGLEPDIDGIASKTDDAVAALLAMVENQTTIVENEGAAQVKVVQTAAKTAETASVAEIDAKGVNTLASIPDDYTALSEAVGVIERGMAPGIICEAEGSAIAVSNASDNYVKNIRIFGRSTQDGVPSPTAPVEIKSVVEPVVTVVGKNLIYEILNGYFNTESLDFISDDKYRLVKAFASGAGTYTFSIYTEQNMRLLRMAQDGKIIKLNLDQNTYTFEVPEASEVWFVFRESNSEELQNHSVQVELGSVATEYEPYKPAQRLELTHTLPGIPVTSGGNYTDSNGQQWICDEVDLERGVYVQRIGSLTFTGDESWSKSQYYENTVQKSRSGLASGSTYLCNMYAETTLNVNHGVVIGGAINVRDDVHAVNVEAWKTHLRELYSDGTPVVIIGALTDPIETPLTEAEISSFRALHTNKPNTTILNDAGAHMAVEYVADTKLYIDNKITALISGV